MNDSPTRKISVSLAIEGLQEASEEVERTRIAYEEARALRDHLIREATDVSVSRLARITGLSRQSIYKISPGRIKD